MSSGQQISTEFLFPSSLYWIDKPEFLQVARDVSEDYFTKAKQKNNDLSELFPVRMTDNFAFDPLMEDLAKYIAQTGWDVLNQQGSMMDDYEVLLHELWAQEHYKLSGHNEHIHGLGAQITGFYILNSPDNGCKIAFHDPRSAKKQINLPEREPETVTLASNVVNYIPVEGRLYLMNAWLPHEFTRNASELPFKFIHFNMTIRSIDKSSKPVQSDTEIVII